MLFFAFGMHMKLLQNSPEGNVRQSAINFAVVVHRVIDLMHTEQVNASVEHSENTPRW